MRTAMTELKSGPHRPNFFMVGCPRCGTTWTNAALLEHPQVFVPEKKQIHFFDENYSNGLEWYLTHFNQAEPIHAAIGEVSTDYSLPHAMQRLANDFPDAKLMMAVRNPIDRAYSFYQSRAPHMEWSSFEEAMEVEPELLLRGRYIEEIECALRFYPRERFKILFYDDLKADDRKYLQSILRYLNVDETFESKYYGNPLRAAMFPRLRRTLKRAGLTPLVNAVNRSPIGDALRRRLRHSRKQRTESVAPKTLKFLRAYYQDLNRQLAQFSGRDLTHWEQ
jgi:hypothetical protein